MHARFRERIARDLDRLGQRLAQARQEVDRGSVERQIRRMLERNRRASGSFAIRVREDRSRASGLRLDWKEEERFSVWVRLTEGAYVLRSNVVDWSPEELWRTYIQLTEAEAAFRVQKRELLIRPIWHQREDRVQAHILVCFLAFALWKTLEGWQKRAGLGSSPPTVLEEMRRI